MNNQALERYKEQRDNNFKTILAGLELVRKDIESGYTLTDDIEDFN